MPFIFPPRSNETSTIEALVEQEKAALHFNERLSEHLLAALPRFGFGSAGALTDAKNFLKDYIDEVVNPQIRAVVLDPHTDPANHLFYQERSPRDRREIKRYNVTLFRGRDEFEDDAQKICSRIYADPIALSLKPVAILNMLHWIFWHECGYFIESKKQKELRASFALPGAV